MHAVYTILRLSLSRHPCLDHHILSLKQGKRHLRKSGLRSGQSPLVLSAPGRKSGEPQDLANNMVYDRRQYLRQTPSRRNRVGLRYP